MVRKRRSPFSFRSALVDLRLIVPLSATIIILLAIVYFGYRQTIAAYPGGGGSYTVAKENLSA